MIEFTVNNQPVALDVDPQMPLLWALRENLSLTGTKFGCGIAQCGACTIHLDGVAVRACVTPVASAAGRHVTTIEGLSQGDQLHPVQQAWIDYQVPQCGYCQSGQIMSATALLATEPQPTDEDIRSGMAGNICRCGMYSRIHKAIRSAADGGLALWEPDHGEQGELPTGVQRG
ncbi:(2Fe-2S)-binding protein [Candidatus Marimicrobium litorale]|uniref:(2Fe-2S)-binding protein n=1 Tax=Candidatus Marimicrobium litorale TaxID=2518991 RepID=A0ABT3T9V2_9GAMM|nr:2Fe-2S iron-sulfur cluster-binding protein [Candidatus Marimicrobium litorale]MCX2979073.1 (2Fe-2S)-binding protein [Candidatus Marimicrobium litorale]